jgi:DeoR/GlpR family transcriptional regulator of sugar metabolism
MPAPPAGIWPASCRISTFTSLPTASRFARSWQTREYSAHLLRRYAPAKYGCYVSASLISQLKSLEIDLFIFSCEGIDSDGALWDSNTVNAEFKSLLLKRAAQSLLLIDKSKFNRSGRRGLAIWMM